MSRFKGSGPLAPPRSPNRPAVQPSRSGGVAFSPPTPSVAGIGRASGVGGVGGVGVRDKLWGTTPSRPPVAQKLLEAPPSFFDKLGFGLLVVFLLGYFSRGFELLPPSLHLAFLLSSSSLLTVLLGGTFMRGLQGKVGVYWLLFTMCLFLSIPGGMWPGGSVAVMTDNYLKALSVYVLMTALTTSLTRVFTILHVVAASVVLGGVYVWRNGVMLEGRLTVLTGGTFGNPNEIASMLSIGIVLWWFVAQRNSTILTVISYCCIAFMAMVALQTGSRGILIAILFSSPILLINYRLAGKVRLVVGAVLVAMLGLAFTPAETQARLLTAIGVNSGSARTQIEASGSAESRKELARRAAVITLQHPILGVGVGNFMIADNAYAQDEGKRSIWHETHNTYLQVSSEAGIPAFIFFLGILYTCWRTLMKARRMTQHGQWHPRQKEMQAAVTALLALLSTVVITCGFGSYAYSPLLPTAAALIVSLGSVIQTEYDRAHSRGLR